MNWIKRLFSKKETTKQCDIHVVICSCGKYEKCTKVYKVKDRGILTNSIYIDSKDFFKCGRVQKQIEKVKDLFNNYI